MWGHCEDSYGDPMTEELLGSCRGTGQRLEGAESEWHAVDSDIRVGIRCCVTWCELLDWERGGAHSGSIQEWLARA